MDFITAFKSVVEKYPKNIAILTDGKSALTYSELYEYVLTIANALNAHNVKKGDVVAISLGKSDAYIAALLGSWFLGAAFMPLLPSLPHERKLFILKNACPKIIIGDVHSLKALPHSSITIDINQIKKYADLKVMVEAKLEPDDMAYIFYTSGSTGTPKGVMVNHGGIVNFLRAQIKAFKINNRSRSLFFVSPSFDASISDIGTAILSGATLCIEKSSSLETASKLPEIFKARTVTHIDLPPSLLEILDINKIPASLKTIVIGGEAVSVEVVRHWAKEFRLINVYGPTETTVCTSLVVCNSKAWDGPDIGTPISGIKYTIVDSRLNRVHEGESGELLISGIGLARGYIGLDKMTREKFITQGGTRYYRTGDLVKKVGDKIYFLGRIDRQVKIHGQLVAPEEIEMQLQNHPSIVRSAVVVDATRKNKSLIAFVQLAKGKQTSSNLLKRYLQNKLPAWMLPSCIVVLPQLPINTNGKINRAKLSAVSHQHPDWSHAESLSDLEAKLQMIWQEVLEKAHVGVEEDFYTLGGDSLSILQAVTEAERYNVHLSIGLIAKLRTIRKIAKWYEKRVSRFTSDGISTSTLKRHALINREWKKLFSDARYLSKKASGYALLTGANGFLGVYTLKELLQRKRNVFALVRAESSKEALARIQSAAHKQGIKFTVSEIAMIKPICGDVTRDRLDVNSKLWAELCNNVSDIYHCAAMVNMVLPHEKLLRANVDAVKNIVTFALTGVKKQINYASTLSVFVATDKNTGVVREADNLSNTKVVYGGYAQSKWIAERFLQQIPKELLEINIFRFGLLTVDSRTGLYSEHDYLDIFIRGLVSLGVVPRGEHRKISLDVTPVDYAAKAFTEIAKSSTGGTYHIANTSGFDLSMIIRALKERGAIIKVLPKEAWFKLVIGKHLGVNEAAAITALARLIPHRGSFGQFRSMDLFQATGIKFDQTNTKKMLENTDIQPPKADATLLKWYIKHIGI